MKINNEGMRWFLQIANRLNELGIEISDFDENSVEIVDKESDIFEWLSLEDAAKYFVDRCNDVSIKYEIHQHWPKGVTLSPGLKSTVTGEAIQREKSILTHVLVSKERAFKIAKKTSELKRKVDIYVCEERGNGRVKRRVARFAHGYAT